MFFLDGLFWFLCFLLSFDLWAMSWIYYAPMCTLLLCDLLCYSVIVWCCLLILSNLMAKKGEYCNVRNNITFCSLTVCCMWWKMCLHLDLHLMCVCVDEYPMM